MRTSAAAAFVLAFTACAFLPPPYLRRTLFVQKKPPTPCTVRIGCGASDSTPVAAPPPAPAPCPDGVNQCFGAMGANCTGLVPNDWGSLFQIEGAFGLGCFDGECWVSAGSWAHDQCCFGMPTGHMCNGLPTITSTACLAEWVTAGHRAQHRLVWKRRVNQCRASTTGVVNFTEYCAPGGTIVAAQDANRCCSGTARALTLADAHLVIAQGVNLDASYVPMVCSGSSVAPSPAPAPAPPPAPAPALKKCLTNAQCNAANHEVCIALNGSTQKFCVAQ